MKRFFNITSVETNAGFEENQVEKFVKQNLPPKEPKKNQTSGMGGFTARFKEIEFCAAELPVNGTVEIFFGVRRISHPVTSRFIVFCASEEKNEYKVTWSCSLS